MAANINPVFPILPKIGFVAIPQAAANVKSTGDGTIATDIFLAFTAGSNGSLIDRIQIASVASAANTTGVATTLRIFASSLAVGTTTPANTILLRELSIPAIASSHATNATPIIEIPMGLALPANWTILVSQHVAQTANQNLSVSVLGGDY